MTTIESQTTPARAPGTVPAMVVPLWPSHGFLDFCRYEIRKGLMLRYWITLPAMWRREQAFRRELTDCLNGHNPMAHTPASGSVPPVVLPIDSENHSERK